MANKPRRWIKLYCYETLHGSVSYQLTEAEQGCWNKLLCQAGLCGMEGVIADHDGRPWPHSHIIQEIHASPEVFESTLKKCIQEGRIIEKNGQGIMITNWKKYQSEYERQKPYRSGSHLDQTPDERREKLAASHAAIVTDEYMDRWEAEHPGQKYPGRVKGNDEK